MMMGSVLEDDTDVDQLIEGQRHKPARIRAGKCRVEASDVLAIGSDAMDGRRLLDHEIMSKNEANCIAAGSTKITVCTY